MFWTDKAMAERGSGEPHFLRAGPGTVNALFKGLDARSGDGTYSCCVARETLEARVNCVYLD